MHHAPGQRPLRDHITQLRHQVIGTLQHHLIRRGRRDLSQRRANRRNPHRITRQRRADPRTPPACLHRADLLRQLRAHTPNRRRKSARDRLADHQRIRRQTPRLRRPTRPARQRMRLVQHQQRARLLRQRLRPLPEIRLRQNHSAIGHRRFSQHRRDITHRQHRLKRAEIVERNGARGSRHVEHLADQSRIRPRPPMAQLDKAILDHAVIAAIEHDDDGLSRHRPRPADHRTVRIRSRKRRLPKRQAKPFGEQCTNVSGLDRRQHERRPPARLLRNGACNLRPPMTEHPRRVAKAEIVIAIVVNIGEHCAFAILRDHRGRRRPIVHPVKRRAKQPMLLQPRRLGRRFRMRGQITLRLTRD